MGFEETRILKCDSCGDELTYAESGVAVQGNIYRVNPNSEDGIGGGLIGNNFIDSSDPSQMVEQIVISTIRVNFYCNDCFKKIADEE